MNHLRRQFPVWGTIVDVDCSSRSVSAAQLDAAMASVITFCENVDRDFSTYKEGSWISRLRRGEAPAKVRQVLRRKGVERRRVNEAVSAAISEDGFDELASCRALAEKRVRALGAEEPVVLRRRLVAFLQRRGFGGSVIGQVLRQVLAPQTEHDSE